MVAKVAEMVEEVGKALAVVKRALVVDEMEAEKRVKVAAAKVLVGEARAQAEAERGSGEAD